MRDLAPHEHINPETLAQFEANAEDEREAARDKVLTLLSQLASATSDAHGLDAVTTDEAEMIGILCAEFGREAALSDVLDRMNEQIARSMARFNARGM